jgi:hypothetical protein
LVLLMAQLDPTTTIICSAHYATTFDKPPLVRQGLHALFCHVVIMLGFSVIFR